jgi:hypothetical protein
MAFTHRDSRTTTHTHDTVTQARECSAELDWQDAETAAELAAEARNERFWEEGTEAQALRYRWEVEQDERNAAFWAGSYVL